VVNVPIVEVDAAHGFVVGGGTHVIVRSTVYVVFGCSVGNALA
jgi:hypothetical protein